MKDRIVISGKHIPTNAPIIGTITYCLLLDRLHAAQWVWGAVGVLLLFAWIAFIVAKVTEKEIIIENKENAFRFTIKKDNP